MFTIAAVWVGALSILLAIVTCAHGNLGSAVVILVMGRIFTYAGQAEWLDEQ